MADQFTKVSVSHHLNQLDMTLRCHSVSDVREFCETNRLSMLFKSNIIALHPFFLFHPCSQAGRFPKFVSRDMEAMYIEELKSSVNLLMANLESMPVSKGGEFKLQKLKRGHNTSIIDMGQEDENQLSKSDVVLSFTLEVLALLRGFSCVQTAKSSCRSECTCCDLKSHL